MRDLRLWWVKHCLLQSLNQCPNKKMANGQHTPACVSVPYHERQILFFGDSSLFVAFQHVRRKQNGRVQVSEVLQHRGNGSTHLGLDNQHGVCFVLESCQTRGEPFLDNLHQREVPANVPRPSQEHKTLEIVYEDGEHHLHD